MTLLGGNKSIFVILFAGFLTVLLFQNCTAANFESRGDLASTNNGGLTSHGHGDGYHGKLSHVVYDVSGSCSSSSQTVKSGILLEENSYYLVVDNCIEILPRLIDPSLIETRSNNTEVLIFNDMAFLEVEAIDPQNAVISYCTADYLRGTGERLIADIALHRDSITGSNSIDYYIEIRDGATNNLIETRERENAPADYVLSTGTVISDEYNVYSLTDPNYREFFLHMNNSGPDANWEHDFHTLSPTGQDYNSEPMSCIFN